MAKQISGSDSASTPAAPVAHRPTLAEVRRKVAFYAKKGRPVPALYAQWLRELEAERAPVVAAEAKAKAHAKAKRNRDRRSLRKQDDRGVVGVGQGLSFWGQEDKAKRQGKRVRDAAEKRLAAAKASRG